MLAVFVLLVWSKFWRSLEWICSAVVLALVHTAFVWLVTKSVSAESVASHSWITINNIVFLFIRFIWILGGLKFRDQSERRSVRFFEGTVIWIWFAVFVCWDTKGVAAVGKEVTLIVTVLIVKPNREVPVVSLCASHLLFLWCTNTRFLRLLFETNALLWLSDFSGYINLSGVLCAQHWEGAKTACVIICLKVSWVGGVLHLNLFPRQVRETISLFFWLSFLNCILFNLH
mgnify:CR=1 FL=1